MDHSIARAFILDNTSINGRFREVETQKHKQILNRLMKTEKSHSTSLVIVGIFSFPIGFSIWAYLSISRVCQTCIQYKISCELLSFGFIICSVSTYTTHEPIS